MKRSAGDQDGPEQKHLVRSHVGLQEGQAQRSAAPLGMIPPQVPSPLQKIVDACKKTIWSGTLDLQNRQDVDIIISGKIHSNMRINTINWPKQLKMTTISYDDYKKLCSLRTQTDGCIFTVDGDWNKMSHGAFIQYISRFRRVCALLEYTSSAIQVLLLDTWLLKGEMITVGLIWEYSNNDRTVKLLTDLGILPRVTAYDHLTKENAMLKEELQQKDKMLVEQQKCHRKDVEMLETEKKEEKARMEKEKDEMQRERDVMQNQILERERTIYQKDSALAKIETSRSELKNQVLAKQATLDKLEKELECPICMDPLNMAVTLGCGHAQCYQCLDTWVDHREPPSCPSCRNVLDSHLACSQVINNCVSIIKESK